MALPENITGMASAQGAQTAVGRSMPAADMDTPPEGYEEASPEEQKLYEDFVTTALGAFYGGPNSPGMLKSLAGGDPRKRLAAIVAPLVVRTAQAAKDRGRPVPFEVILNGTMEIASALMEDAEEAGATAFADDRMVYGATMAVVDKAREQLQAAGLISKAEMDGYLEDMKAADQAGTLERGLQAPGMVAERDAEEGGDDMGETDDGDDMAEEGGGIDMQLTRQQRRRRQRREKKRQMREARDGAR